MQIFNQISLFAATTENKPLVDKAEATALALGIAKLMKIKTHRPLRPDHNDDHDKAGELVAKHLDSDFSCFLCRKKCRTRARFFLHFKRHFNKAQSEAGDDGPEGDSSSSNDDDNEEPIHMRGLKPEVSRHQESARRRRPAKSQRKRLTSTSKGVDQDGDSGCHSAGGVSSSNGELTSDCPGDSESSESDSEAKKDKCLEKRWQTKSTSHKDGHQKNKLSLAEKQLDNNETQGLVCLTCLKRFSNCQNLRRHLRLHIARDSIQPDFDEEESLIDDGVEAASKGRYLCDWCPARFDNRSAARVHETSHRGQEAKCYVCSKLYADRYSLRYHLRTHGIGRQIRCEHCRKAFSKPSRLAAHIRSHHKNIRDFVCPTCNKAFKTRVHLNNHFRQHSGEKPFECKVCHERFRHKASMITHCRKHDGQRPYCCEVCGKTFREPSTLKAHSRVHSGDKPYTCGQCGKSFTQRAGLNYHKRASHENLRPHVCRLCPFSTVKAASLTAHYRNIHQQSPPSNQPQTQAQVSDETINNAAPLPSFDHLKSPNDDPFIPTNSSPGPVLTPPSSSSPASSTSSTPCLEDFLQSNSESSEYPLPNMGLPHQEVNNSVDEYNYGYGYQQSRQYHQDLHMHHVQPPMHQHHQQQQQTHQWFSYASQHQQSHPHQMVNHPPPTPPPAPSYSYGNGYYFAAAALASAQASMYPSAPQSTMGFNYESYSSHPPSYCI